MRSVSSLPIVAQMTTEDDGNSLDGTPPETFTPELERAGADVIGVNCSVGPAAMLETIETMARLTSARLIAQPNAGRPRDVDGRNLYLCSPDYMASYARRFIAAGARLVGGCCGTTPEHIRQIAVAVKTVTPGGARRRRPSRADGRSPGEAGACRARRRVGARSCARRAASSSSSSRSPRRAASICRRPCRRRSASATSARSRVDVPDYPKSGARASALAPGVLLEQQGGVETLLHYSCRDRNLIGMQSDLVGAHAMGLRNVLLTTGNPAPQATYADATSVFDVDAIGLTNMVSRLNHGLDIGGQSIGAPTRFHIGVAVNPFAPEPGRRVAAADAQGRGRRRVHRHAAASSTRRRSSRCSSGCATTGLPVLAGLAALEGLRHAEFLASEVVGVKMPDAILDRLRGAQRTRPPRRWR